MLLFLISENEIDYKTQSVQITWIVMQVNAMSYNAVKY